MKSMRMIGIELYIQGILFLNTFKLHMYSLCLRFWHPRQPIDVYAVKRYKILDEDEFDVQNITMDYINAKHIPIETNEFVEMRMLWKTDPYRYLIYKTDPNFPSYDQFTKSISPMTRIICAILINPNNQNTNDECDVLSRVCKFAGPKHDFFNKPIKVRYMFMNDGTDENTRLYILRQGGKVNEYKMNDYIYYT